RSWTGKAQRNALIEDLKLPIGIGDGGRRRNDFRHAQAGWSIPAPPLSDMQFLTGQLINLAEDLVEEAVEEPAEGAQTLFEEVGFILNDQRWERVEEHPLTAAKGREDRLVTIVRKPRGDVPFIGWGNEMARRTDPAREPEHPNELPDGCRSLTKHG